MKQEYSFWIGLRKTAIQVAIFGGSMALVFLAFANQALLDAPLWALVEQYLKPLLGSLTLGGAITLGVNWLKNK